MSSCTSASSRHTRKSAAGHSLSRHPAHAGEGWRLVRWILPLPTPVAGPQLMSIHHRLSVPAGDRPWHPVPPPQIRLKKEHDHIRRQAQVAVRARWFSSNAYQRLSAAGWQFPLPARLWYATMGWHPLLRDSLSCFMNIQGPDSRTLPSCLGPWSADHRCQGCLGVRAQDHRSRRQVTRHCAHFL